VIAMLLEDGEPDLESNFVGLQQIMEPPERGLRPNLKPRPNHFQLAPAQPQRQCVEFPIAQGHGRRECMDINQGGARMDDTPPRYLSEAR
jgi:hypothetical protein